MFAISLICNCVAYCMLHCCILVIMSWAYATINTDFGRRRMKKLKNDTSNREENDHFFFNHIAEEIAEEKNNTQIKSFDWK